ncbi:MAG: alpha-hydroxy-acid oxidizing protein [Treponema sp.]|nr:alpha-hydroxy-acid oxidizing protein [Treponema sp.]
MPGLGGVFESKNFQLNCAAWGDLRKKAEQEDRLNELQQIKVTPDKIRCGPVTGAVENIGYAHERDFYYPYLKNAAEAGYGLCVGDGCPDEKLHYGIDAVKALGQSAAFFLKPYPTDRLLERLTWIKPYAEYIGIDIDSYNIVTMRNLVNLEKKTAAQLNAFRKEFDVPFVIKGVFTDDDIELVRQVKPDVVYISNHGGRVETRIGSTGDFLLQNADELKKYCKQLWVDGGIRTIADVQTALYYGADQVIAARPFIRATFDEEPFQLT